MENAVTPQSTALSPELAALFAPLQAGVRTALPGNGAEALAGETNTGQASDKTLFSQLFAKLTQPQASADASADSQNLETPLAVDQALISDVERLGERVLHQFSPIPSGKDLPISEFSGWPGHAALPLAEARNTSALAEQTTPTDTILQKRMKESPLPLDVLGMDVLRIDIPGMDKAVGVRIAAQERPESFLPAVTANALTAETRLASTEVLQPAEALASDNRQSVAGVAPLLTRDAILQRSASGGASYQDNLEGEAGPLKALEGVTRPETIALAALTPGNTASALPVNAPPAARPLELSLPNPYQNELQFVESFSEKVAFLSSKGQQSATLQMNPHDLGQLQIRVTVANAATQVEVHAFQSETGDLMESMLPKLQQALEQQGLKLDDIKLSQSPLFGDGARSQQQFQQSTAGSSESREPSAENSQGEERDAEFAEEQLLMTVSSNRSIDFYA